MLVRLLIAAVVSLLSGSVALAFPPGTAQSNDSLLVVVSATCPASDISLATLRRAFSSLPAEHAGMRLIPINHPTGSLMRAAFDEALFSLDVQAMARFWVDKRIRDEGAPPKAVPSPKMAVRVVASLPGAITYATRDLLSPSVKALSIDGVGPSQPGYPLTP